MAKLNRELDQNVKNGISIDLFAKNCSFLSFTRREIVIRLLMATGK